MIALQNQIRAAFPRELAAIAQRARSRKHDPRAACLIPRGFEKWERIARGEEAQRIAEGVRKYHHRWRRCPTLDQWVEQVYCAGFGMADAGAAATRPLGPTDALGGVGTVVGYLQGELGITTATGVSGWAAQLGGTTLDASQGTGGQQPVYAALDSTIWSRSTVRGDGSNDVLNTAWNPPAPGTTPTWVRTVMSRNADAASATLFASSGTSFILYRDTSTTMRAFNTTNTSQITVALTTWFRTETLFNNATTDYLKIGATSVTGVNTGNTDPAGFRFFASTSAGATPGNYSLQKVLVLNAAPTALQKAILDEMDRRYYNGNIAL